MVVVVCIVCVGQIVEHAFSIEHKSLTLYNVYATTNDTNCPVLA